MRPRAVALVVLVLLALAAVTPPPGRIRASLRARLGRFYTGLTPVDRAVEFLLGGRPHY